MATDGAACAVCVARIDGQFDGKSVIAAKATTYGCPTETKPRNMPILWITSFADKFVAPSLAYNEVRYSLMRFRLAGLAITDLGHAPGKRSGTACGYRDTP